MTLRLGFVATLLLAGCQEMAPAAGGVTSKAEAWCAERTDCEVLSTWGWMASVRLGEGHVTLRCVGKKCYRE